MYSFFFKNDDLLLSRGQISANLPDLCIVYKLYLECGKLINLFDWLQVGDDDDDDTTMVMW